MWQRVQQEFGGQEGHSFDLMALGSNAQMNRRGIPLPHFMAHSVIYVNLFAEGLADESLDMRNPYVFPPFCLIAAVLKFLLQFRIPLTMVVPDSFPRQVWWPSVLGYSSRIMQLCTPGDTSALLFPSKSGFHPRPSTYALVAYRSFLTLFQPLPRIPKLFIPSVACPECHQANDEDFTFC
jgi:hypothetical protein